MSGIPTTPNSNVHVPVNQDFGAQTLARNAINSDHKATLQQQFEEQCFLMEYYDQIHSRVGARGGESPNELSFSNFSRLLATPSTIKEVLGRLTRREKLAPYLRSTPAAQASMVPVVSIRKIYVKPGGLRESREIKFEDYTKLDSITSTAAQRGHGAGIISFNYVHDSTNPGNSMVMKCKIKFYFQSIDVFLSEWEDAGQTVRYTDLINMDRRVRSDISETKALLDGIMPGVSPDANNRDGWHRDLIEGMLQTSSQEHYEIKGFIGWNVTRESLINIIGNESAGTAMYESIMNNGYAIRLNLKKHNINFQEDGSLMLDTDWVGGIESKMNSPLYDVFLNLI